MIFSWRHANMERRCYAPHFWKKMHPHMTAKIDELPMSHDDNVMAAWTPDGTRGLGWLRRSGVYLGLAERRADPPHSSPGRAPSAIAVAPDGQTLVAGGKS